MTDTSMPTRFAESDFRVGRVLSRSGTVLSQHLLVFAAITAAANLPALLLFQGGQQAMIRPDTAPVVFVIGLVVSVILTYLAQAVILHVAFQAMRGKAVNLGEALSVGLSRFFPIFGLAIILGFLVGLATLALIVPGLILLTMWFVGAPVCVVERLGPWSSLKRSAELTKGHRWKVFGLMILLLIISVVVSQLITLGLSPVGSFILTLVASLVWAALWGAYYSIAVAVSYHDLRVAKEGIDIEQIASVFD
jgi:hypothetical protein